MPDPQLTQRMRDYFNRQIAWFNQTLEELQQLEEAVDGSELEAYVARQRAHGQTTAALAQEFELLQREWACAANLSEEERIEVNALAAEAEKLSAVMSERFDAAAAAVDARLREVRDAIDELNRGRGAMRKYGGDDPDAGYFDREA